MKRKEERCPIRRPLGTLEVDHVGAFHGHAKWNLSLLSERVSKDAHQFVSTPPVSFLSRNMTYRWGVLRWWVWHSSNRFWMCLCKTTSCRPWKRSLSTLWGPYRTNFLSVVWSYGKMWFVVHDVARATRVQKECWSEVLSVWSEIFGANVDSGLDCVLEYLLLYCTPATSVFNLGWEAINITIVPILCHLTLWTPYLQSLVCEIQDSTGCSVCSEVNSLTSGLAQLSILVLRLPFHFVARAKLFVACSLWYFHGVGNTTWEPILVWWVMHHAGGVAGLCLSSGQFKLCCPQLLCTGCYTLWANR